MKKTLLCTLLITLLTRPSFALEMDEDSKARACGNLNYSAKELTMQLTATKRQLDRNINKIELETFVEGYQLVEELVLINRIQNSVLRGDCANLLSQSNIHNEHCNDTHDGLEVCYVIRDGSDDYTTAYFAELAKKLHTLTNKLKNETN
ncbi:exported hypothetical protein [Vibrio chagasii]|nr:exported hypothetical protein [Vibrio chagasii]